MFCIILFLLYEITRIVPTGTYVWTQALLPLIPDYIPLSQGKSVYNDHKLQDNQFTNSVTSE